MADDFSKLKKTFTDIPDRIKREIESPRDIPQSMGIKMKEVNKKFLEGLYRSGQLKPEMPIRFTTVDEIHNILTTGQLRSVENLMKHIDAEGRQGISAQLSGPNKPLIAYGSNTRVSAAIIFPNKSIEGKGMAPNEVKINPKTSISDLKFVIGGHEELLDLSSTFNTGSKEAIRMSEHVIPEHMAFRPGVNRESAIVIAAESSASKNIGSVKAVGNSKVMSNLLKKLV